VAASHDGATGGSASESSGAAGVAGVAGAAGAAGAGHGCARDLSGTWDLVANRPGHVPGSGVMVIGANVSSIAIVSTGSLDFSGDKLEYTRATNQVTWQVGNDVSRVIMAENTPAAFDGGSLPIAVGGAWTFSTAKEQCMLNVAPTLVTASCLGQPGQPDDLAIGGEDWPLYAPRGVNGRAYSATRTAALASSFGDLGGQWGTRSGATDHSCAVTVADGALTAHCTFDRFNGTTTLTIDDDCVASGTTQDGVELGARRR
jgi:hypothetical protein